MASGVKSQVLTAHKLEHCLGLSGYDRKRVPARKFGNEKVCRQSRTTSHSCVSFLTRDWFPAFLNYSRQSGSVIQHLMFYMHQDSRLVGKVSRSRFNLFAYTLLERSWKSSLWTRRYCNVFKWRHLNEMTTVPSKSSCFYHTPPSFKVSLFLRGCQTPVV